MDASNSVKGSCLSELFCLAGSTAPLNAPDIGLSESLLYQIQNLTNVEMRQLVSRHSGSVVHVSIDVDRLTILVKNIKNIEDERNSIMEYIKLGASLPLMKKLFGLRPSEFSAIRKAANMEASKGGKPCCSIEGRLDIVAAWESLGDIDERSRYLSVSKLTGLPLRSIHMVVCQEEANQLESSRRAARIF
ncbi:MAG: DUF2857 domain-containing protein [Gammaproteobacteria bacterium]|nr:DUF2857 domain-containing protein [Gammaproteobacteria bacterium]